MEMQLSSLATENGVLKELLARVCPEDPHRYE